MKRFLWIFAVLSLGAAVAAAAEDAENFEYRTVTTKEGLTYRVPEDMPIENRNGIQAPIPFDEYMYGKFKRMDARLKEMGEQLDRIEQLLLELKEGGPAKALRAQ